MNVNVFIVVVVDDNECFLTTTLFFFTFFATLITFVEELVLCFSFQTSPEEGSIRSSASPSES